MEEKTIKENTKKINSKNVLIVSLLLIVIVLTVLCSVFGVRLNKQKDYNIAYIKLGDGTWQFTPIKSYKIMGSFIELIDPDGLQFLLGCDSCVLLKDDTLYRTLRNS